LPDVFLAADERPHDGATDEWVFAAWTADARLGVVSGHRLGEHGSWYWAALVRAGRPLLHVLDADVPRRSDPFVLKGHEMWAEHHCDDPLRQWSVGNETYAAALDDPADALGRAYGVPTPIAFDLEWYAVDDPAPVPHGLEQVGVVHGAIEIAGEPHLELTEVPARRWRRWIDRPGVLPPLDLAVVRAHAGLRAPFRFPDGTALDLVLTPDGWACRARS
jgi:hypothetical protein